MPPTCGGRMAEDRLQRVPPNRRRIKINVSLRPRLEPEPLQSGKEGRHLDRVLHGCVSIRSQHDSKQGRIGRPTLVTKDKTI